LTTRIALVDRSVTRALRRSVLRPSWPADAEMHGDENPEALHFAVFDGDQLVAACLVFPQAYPRQPAQDGAWQLRGMATEPSRQGEGHGTRLIEAVVEQLRAQGARLVWCEARSSAMRFYERHGFVVDGVEYLHSETQIPHHHMYRLV
jgi:GNAT superfamily N-acetyltransferase